MTTPAQRPGPVTLQGRYGRLEKLDAAARGGPVGGVRRARRRSGPTLSTRRAVRERGGVCRLASRMRAAADDPYAYAIIDPVRPRRRLFDADATSCRQMRVIEVGHVLYSPALQRTPLGTEAQYLLARYAFETLGYRRYEWKCNALNAASRRAALRYGFTYEGTFRQHMIAKRPQPRQRLVLHARRRMAGAQGAISSAGWRRKTSPRTASRRSA